MSRDTSLRWAAGCGALATLVLGGLLAFRDHSLLTAFAVAPLIAGLLGLSARKTWGAFATFGGAALILVAHAVGEVPVWAAMIAVGGLAVATPALIRATRFDAPAAAVWVVLAGLSGSGAALAWEELDVPPPAPPVPPLVVKTVVSPGWHFSFGFDDGRGECDRCGCEPRYYDW